MRRLLLDISGVDRESWDEVDVCGEGSWPSGRVVAVLVGE